MDTLSLLVEHLKKFRPIGNEPRPEALNFVLNYTQFVQVLERINKRVGWAEAKKEVASKVKSMIVNYRRYGKPVENELLHTLILGDPGVGKTMFGGDLAELWAVSGCLKPSTTTTTVVKQINPENVSIQQKLIVKESQMKSLQDVHQQNRIIAAQAITLLNRLRKRVRGHGADFQELKRVLQQVSSSGGASPLQLNPNIRILPVIVPVSGIPVEFGSIPLPASQPILPGLISSNSVLPTLPDQPVKFKFGIFTRGDFIAKFQGHSTDRVRALFREYEGGVIMIDEAYDLATTEQDDFGREVLTEIINYMTRFPDKIIFIFSGYKDQMEKTVLAMQPGLIRRFKWKFEIKGYSDDEVCQIFSKQLSSIHLNIRKADKEKVDDLIKQNVSKGYFKYFGGDTERLSNYVRDTMQEKLFDHALNDRISSEAYINLFEDIPYSTITEALQKYIQNYSKDTSDKPPDGMYI